MKRLCVALSAAIVALVLAAPVAFAAGQGKTAGGPRKMPMTEVVTAADYQQIEGGPLLIAAYAVVWVIFFLAVLYLFWRIRKVLKEVRRLEGLLDEQGQGPRSGERS